MLYDETNDVTVTHADARVRYHYDGEKTLCELYARPG
jgi:hypothetical protein